MNESLRTELAKIDNKAEKTHEHLAETIVQSPKYMFVTDEDKANWNGKLDSNTLIPVGIIPTVQSSDASSFVDFSGLTEYDKYIKLWIIERIQLMMDANK